VTDSGIISFARAMPTLRELHAEECEQITDVGIDAMAMLCKSLQYIKVSSCYNVSTQGFASLAQYCPGLLRIQADWTSVDDSTLEALGRRCAELQHLDLTGVTDVTDVGLIALAPGDRYVGEVSPISWQGCPNLRELRLSGNTRITDEGVSHLARHCTNLEMLEIAGSGGDWQGREGITDATLVHLGQCCPRLRILDSARNPGVTDQGLSALMRGCQALEHVLLSYCSITDTGLVNVAQFAGAALEQLCVAECTFVTLDGVKLLRSRRPGIKVVHNALELESQSIDCLWELGE